jgi:DNA polymerase III epsilon subunit-like protein
MISLYAFLDCETSDLIKPNAPLEEQPHLLEIAVKLVTEDREQVGGFSRIITPDGWSIEPEAEKIHGISTDLAAQCGVDLWVAMFELQATLKEATHIIGHNIQGFDRPIITYSMVRAEGPLPWWTQQARKMVDTQELATPILKLPGEYDSYKFPKLEEAARFFGWDAYEVTHRAGYDISAVEHVYWSIVERFPRATA